MIQTDQKGLMYSSMIDRHIQKLFSTGIDLKRYFESSLVNYKIQSLSFQEYHTDPKKIIAFSNKDTLFQAN